MATNFLPSRDADLVTWSVNFNTKITAAPTDYGLTAGQATAYDALHDAFVAAYQTASNPDTRSPSNIIAKDTARDALEANARQLARIVQATPGVTAEQKSELGLTVRDTEPTPIPPPSEAPTIDVVSMTGHTLRIRLHEPGQPTKRSKPDGVQGASVFSFVGAAPPIDIASWKFEGSTTRTTADVEFPSELEPGTKVWVTAFWYNPRAQSGPAAEPVSALIQFGGVTQAA